MKKIVLISAITLSSIFTYGQACIPDGSITDPGIYPDTLVNLPHAYYGAVYNTTVQVNTLTDTLTPQGNVDVDDITLNSVTGLPAGFTYACNPATCVFPAGQTKCLAVNGNLAVPYAAPGTYPLVINVTLHGRLFGIIPVSQASQIVGYKIIILGTPVANFSGTPTTLCKGSTATFTDLSINEPTSWSWSFPGGTPSSSSLQVPPSITYSTTGTKNVTLLVTSPAGSNSLTKTAYITVNALPAATVSPAGFVVICSGSSVLLSANTGSNLSYQWIKYSTDIAGATSSTYLATSGGNYKVRITKTTTGCTKTSAITTVSVATVTATATAQGPTTFCSGGNVTISANSGAGLTYQWVKWSTDIVGATSQTYMATASGTYKVRVTDINSCSKTSAGVSVTVNALPSATVTANGPLSFCTGGSVIFTAASGAGYTYQWKKNGSNIIGATSQQYTATTAGTYRVVVTNSNGCTKQSSGQVVTVPCKVQGDLLSEDKDFSIFPNPADESITINSDAGDVQKIIIFDALGRQVFSKLYSITNSNHLIQIDISAFSKGVYFVQVLSADKTKSLKLVVE